MSALEFCPDCSTEDRPLFHGDPRSCRFRRRALPIACMNRAGCEQETQAADGYCSDECRVAVKGERVLSAYDRLWHRASAHQDGDLITRLLPSPHQLRTGEKPSDLLDRITRTGTLDRG